MKKYFYIAVITIFVIVSGYHATVAYGVSTTCTANIALPDPKCTPGVVLTTDVKTICTVGYTTTVRDVTTATKKQVFKNYGIPFNQSSNYEVDHLISLELGGSNDIKNLFPESYSITNGARTKDKFENYLHRQVCNGSMTIQEAQKQISADWLKYYTLTLSNTIATTTITASTSKTTLPEVKKSSSGICTSYYNQTTRFTPFVSIQACLNSGGRLPK